MSFEYSRFYTECEHSIAAGSDPADSTDPANNGQEIINGRCPTCPDAPRGLVESSTEPLLTAPLISYVRTLRGRAQKMIGSLRSTSSDENKVKGERGSAQTVSMTSSMNLDCETGKENISTRHLSVDKFVGVPVTGGITNALAAKQSGGDGCSTRVINKTGAEAKAEREAPATEAARKKILNLVSRIGSNFDTMRDQIESANQRIADIDNFKLADFMCQGVDRWTAAVKQAMKNCEDDLVKECMELAKTR